MNNYKTGRSLLLLLTILIIGLSSCRSYKDLPEAPKADAQGIIRDGDENKGDTTTIANIPWKEYFKDTNLQALITEGLEKNIDMQIASVRIKQAEANLTMSAANNQPTVSAGLRDDYTRLSSGNQGTKVLGYTSNVTSLGFSATWEVDLWGKLNSQTKAKYISFLNSYEYKNLVQTQIIANIVKAYYNLLAYDEQLRISRETIILLQKSEETMESLMNAGQQSGAAVEQSKALLYSTQLKIPALESLIRQQENAICLLLGRKSGTIARASITDQAVNEHLAYGVPLQMLSKRPDVRQAELSFRSTCTSVEVANASLYPSLTISSASLGLAAGSFSNLFKPASIAAEIVGGITQPILNKKQLKGNLKVAQAQQEEALLIFQNTVLTAGQEVSNILYGYKSSLGKNEFRAKQISSLTKAVDFTQDLLKAGEANYTEVLTAQQNLLSAQLSQVDDKLEQLTYGVSLYKSLGGGTK
ncbi:MAG: efflux transporter outer membrane subunit [Bacteroidota bacterium]|nr:efflux transporter outer membrane subunit [Bacteroidota bacterium]